MSESTPSPMPETVGVAPALPLYWSDLARAGAGLGLYFAVRGLEHHLARGRGEPVLVLPGLLADDVSTRALRSTLRRVGHRAHAWRLGRNYGPTPATLAGLAARVEELADREGPVSIVGWSLGGIYARLLARRVPERITRVVTLGSPFALRGPEQSRAHAVFSRWAHLHDEDFALPSPEERDPLPVPATSIYSRLDGIVAWQACLDRVGPTSENVAVYGSHFGLGHHPAVLWAVADRLAQPADRWTPFAAPAALRWAFPAPDRPAAALLAPPVADAA